VIYAWNRMISKMLNAALNLKTLIENFAPDDDIRYALLLTYNFDGAFLEDAEHGLLETLWRRNCENPIVVRDGKAVVEEKRSHRYSVINAAYSTRTFHPKLTLLVAPSEVLAVVGSANLTRGGLEKNLELMAVYQLTRSKGPVGFFRSVHDFLDNHLRRELSATSDQLQGAFDLMVDDLELFLIDARSARGSEDVELTFLHNYSEPLLPQIAQALPDKTLDEVWILSPFFEPEASKDEPLHRTQGGHDDPPGEALDQTLIDEFFRRFTFADQQEQPVVHFYFEASTTSTTQLPVNVLRPYRSQISLHVKNLAAEDQRRLHAKALVFIGRNYITLVHGSANFTRAALLSTPPGGNSEMIALTRLPRASATAEKLAAYLNLADLFVVIDKWDNLSYAPLVLTPSPARGVQVWEGMVSLADKRVTVFFRVDDLRAHHVVVSLCGDQSDLPLGEIRSPFPVSQVFALPEAAIVTMDALRGLLQLPYHSVRVEAFDADGGSLAQGEGPLNVDCPAAFVGTWLCRPEDLTLDNQIYLAGLGSVAGYAAQRAAVERTLSTPTGDSPPAPSHQADLDLFFRRLHVGFRGLRRRLEQSRASRYVFSDILRQLGGWAQSAIEDDGQNVFTTEQKLYLCDRVLETVLECVEVMRKAKVKPDELASMVYDRFLLPAQPMLDFTQELCLDQNAGVIADNLLGQWDALRSITKGNER
jgi:hypothetical protein